MAKHKPVGKQYYTFLPIPYALRYEVNCLGILRNRKTGRIIKWCLSSNGSKNATVIDDHGKKISVTLSNLLWLVHGKLVSKSLAIPVTIQKGYRRLRFDSLRQCVSFLANVTNRKEAGIWTHLVRRHKSIDDWTISYFR